MSAKRPLIDLAAERHGGRAVAANDEFFASKENLLKGGPALFVADKFTDRGKWMDGWETRRRRDPGHDWCVIRLGIPGVISQVIVDTQHFKGNQPEGFSVMACWWDGSAQESPPSEAGWTEIVARTPARPDAENLADVADPNVYTHVRLDIHPDGGVARFRVLGAARPDWSAVLQRSEVIDLVAVENGGVPIACSDECFGEPAHLLLPGRPVNMGDGWETRRRRGPGDDWVVLRLGRPGIIERIEVDTCHFKGNFPESCSLESCDAGDEARLVDGGNTLEWTAILARTPLQADTQHRFSVEPVARAIASHVRFRIYPDGGVGRLRVLGRIVPDGAAP